MQGLSLRRIGSLVGLTVLGLAIVLAVILAAPGLVGAESSLVVESDSMSPAISAGDLVVLSATDPTSLTEETVVTFRTQTGDGTLVTHRVVDAQESSDGIRYRTKGDANEDPDRELVAPSQVVGTVWFSIPLIGYVVMFANTDLGLFSLVIVPALLLLVSELYSLYVDATSDSPLEESGAR